MVKIKIGYLISYDYELLFNSLPQVYDAADEIFLAIDKENKTWTGNTFYIPDHFFDRIKELDKANKITLYFDSFFLPSLTSMQCETRERNLLAKQMGKGWLLQLDVDEYIYDFKKLKKFLRRYWYLTLFPEFSPVVFRGMWITLFKEIKQGYLYIENNELFPFITNVPRYEIARVNRSIRHFNINTKVIHQSWARSEEEIASKLSNWGHKDDFDTAKYLEFWKSIDASNYTDVTNFHPILPQSWDKLHFIAASDITDFVAKYQAKNPQKLKPVGIGAFLKALLNKIFGTKIN